MLLWSSSWLGYGLLAQKLAHSLLGQYESKFSWEMVMETEVCDDVLGRFQHGQSMQHVAQLVT